VGIPNQSAFPSQNPKDSFKNPRFPTIPVFQKEGIEESERRCRSKQTFVRG
jgi:hypothetical protein